MTYQVFKYEVSKLVISLDVFLLFVGIGNHVKKPLSVVVTSNV